MPMTISTKGRYAIRALIEIALNQDKGLVLVKDVSVSQAISEKYLERIFSSLKSAGFVKSRRGCKGGYILARKPEEINILDVLKALEGSLAPVECVETPSCTRLKACAARLLWIKLNSAIERTLGAATLAVLVDEQRRLSSEKQPLMFQI